MGMTNFFKEERGMNQSRWSTRVGVWSRRVREISIGVVADVGNHRAARRGAFALGRISPRWRHFGSDRHIMIGAALPETTD